MLQTDFILLSEDLHSNKHDIKIFKRACEILKVSNGIFYSFSEEIYGVLIAECKCCG